MREILRAARERDADVAAWLEVIDQFDHAVAARASVEELVRLAADITGLTVGVREEWTRVRLEVADGVLRADDSVAVQVAPARLRGRGAVEIETSRGPALAAPIGVAVGPVGFAWVLSSGASAWEPGHHLVVERLAGAVAARTLEARKRRSTSFDPAAVERLLCGGLADDELAQAARQAKLSASDRYVAVALAQRPAEAVSLEALAGFAERAIAEKRLAARSAVIGRLAAVVARAGSALPAALEELSAGEPALGFKMYIGVGDAGHLVALPRSWAHAQEALALRRMLTAQDAPAYFDRLGVLHLLGQIPMEQALASEPFGRLSESLAADGSPSDLEVLEAYLEEGTLRRAGDRVFLHHTTVQHRLKGIEERLQVDLAQPATRFGVQLALKLLAIARARADSEG